MSVKFIHLSCVVVTFLLFSLRGIWMLLDSPLRQNKVIRILPHVNDTLLLLSGLFIAISWYDAFYTQQWLQAKFIALFCYIFSGSIALKYGSSKKIRALALLVSWLIFIYIVLVAYNKNPMVF